MDEISSWSIMSETLIIQKYDEVYVKIRAEASTAYELKEHFKFFVPGAKFSPQYRNKVWDGHIYLYNVMTGLIYAGLVPYIENFAKEREYTIEYDGDFTQNEFSLKEAEDFIKTIDLPEQYSVRDYQLGAFVHAVRNHRSLLLSPTASGKSLIIYLLMRYYNARTLIIVPTTSLVSQLSTDFSDYGFDSDSKVHKIHAGKSKQSNLECTISTWQSIYKMPKDYFNSFDVIIGDEAHLFKAKSLVSIMSKMISCKYRFGFTGTLDGTQTNKLVLEGLFGAVKKVTTTAELIVQKHLAEFKIKAIVLSYDEITRKMVSKMDYQDEIDWIVRNPSRNKFIKNLALSLKGNSLLLFQFVEKHGDVLFDMINKAAEGRNVYYVAGKTETEDRERIRKIVETETDAIIVASSGVFSTGINIKNLHNVVFTSPSKSRIKNLQSIGRVLRRSDSKESAVLYDIADDLSFKAKQNYTIHHFKERIKIYSEEQFPYKIYSVSLKT
jgi:superfamily II DNA or RNA helicase